MRRSRLKWWRLLLIIPLSGYCFGAAGCLADMLRNAAGELEGEEQSDWDQLLDDVGNLFD